MKMVAMLHDLNLKYQRYEIMNIRSHDIVNCTKNFKGVGERGEGVNGLFKLLIF